MLAKTKRFSSILTTILLCLGTAFAQSTEITYQGRLLNGTSPANGSHDFEFSLFDAITGGGQIGSAVSLTAVNVNNGVFSVRIDFGNQFPGANRYLEIRVKEAGGSEFTTLTPRQAISSAPYAIKSLNSENAVTANSANSATSANTATNSLRLSGVDGRLYVVTGDTRLSDARTPLPNSPDYIQNRATQQATTNFNISGNGTAAGTLSGGIVNAVAQYNIGGSRVLGVGTQNIFVGIGAGEANAGGFSNSFFGRLAGASNTTGNYNSFSGMQSGFLNTTGSANSFFGYLAGQHNTASNNSFFGAVSGEANTTGANNSFVGFSAGANNTTGTDNSFFGASAGESNLSGNNNAFFGRSSGQTNSTASNNSFFGSQTGMANTTGAGNSFFGTTAGNGNTTGSGNSFFGNRTGFHNTTGNGNAIFGDGTGFFNAFGSRNSYFGAGAGSSNTSGNDNAIFGNGAGFISSASFNSFFGSASGTSNTSGARNSFFGFAAGNANFTGANLTIIGADADVSADGLNFATAIGAGAVVSASNTVVLGRSSDVVLAPGKLKVNTLASAGSTQVCRNGGNELSTCSSSIRYKTNINPFNPGLSLIRRLRPVAFTWKDGGMLDFGLVAEEVSTVEPLLTTANERGEVEGVKYDRVGIVLINAVNEQQTQIENQQKRIDSQQKQIEEQKAIISRQQAGFDALKKLVCSQNPAAELCRPNN